MDASDRLIKASKSGNVKEVRKLLSRGALFTKDEFGNTALHEAAWSGNNEIVKILLKAYCFVDSVNGAGFTPLHLASQNGHAKVAKTLLKWKGNSTLKNQHEEAPIHLIAKYDHAHLVPVFAAAKTDLDLKAKDDNTALHIAAKLGNIQTVKVLIQHGANPNVSNEKSKLPLDYAEFSRCQEAIKLLLPCTQAEPKTKLYKLPDTDFWKRDYSQRASSTASSMPFTRSQTASGRSADQLYRPQTDIELSKEAKGRRSFFKAKSSKSSKDANNKSSEKSSGPIYTSGNIQMRQRSNTIAGTTSTFSSKRYSREFEDVSPFLLTSSSSSKSSSSSSSQLSHSRRSKTRSPSLEDLLEEVEKETKGPDHRYVPPPLSDSDNDTGSVSCHPLNRMSNSSLSPSPNNNYNFFKSPNLTPSSRGHHSPSPLLKSPQQSKDPLYDFLSPQGFLKPRGSKTIIDDQEKKDDDYVCLRPSSEYQKRALSEFRNERNTYSVPLLSDEVLSHTYEYLPPLPKDEIKKEQEGFESYIEMAPTVDIKPKMSPKKVPSSPLKFSPAKKVAMIADSPKEERPQAMHEPADKETTPRSILTQFEGEKRNSEIDKYLQDELDTIRQAFQIRLTQMEKRYKRHLASVSSVHKTSSNSTVSNGPQPENDTFTRKHNRRASWHGKMEDNDANSLPSGPAYPLGSGFDSGSDESLSSSFADSSVCDGFSTVGESSEQNRLDQINDVHQEERVQDFTGVDDDSALPVDMKAIIQERVQQYKEQMMQQWMREAEEKIAGMERDYIKKMNAQKLYHLPSNQVKGPDRSETFV